MPNVVENTVHSAARLANASRRQYFWSVTPATTPQQLATASARKNVSPTADTHPRDDNAAHTRSSTATMTPHTNAYTLHDSQLQHALARAVPTSEAYHAAARDRLAVK